MTWKAVSECDGQIMITHPFARRSHLTPQCIPSNFIKLSLSEFGLSNCIGTEGHLICTYNWREPQIRQSVYNKSVHCAVSKLPQFEILSTFESPRSENAVAIKGGEAVSEAPSSNADMEKIPRNLTKDHKGEEGLPIL